MQQMTTNEVEKEILRITDTWPKALVEKDITAIKCIIAEDEVTFIESDGTHFDRSQYIARVRNANPLDSVEYTNRKIRVFGDVAVLTGRSVVKGRRDGEKFTNPYSVSDIFVKQQDGSWRVISAQMTPETSRSNLPISNPVKYERK